MALGVSAYSETPFGAEASDVIAYPSGIALTSQIENSTAQANADVSVTGESLTSTVATANTTSVVDVFVTGNSLTFAVGDEESFTDITVEVTSAGNLTVTNITTYEDTLTAFAEAPFASESPSTIAPENVIVTANADIIPATNLLTTTIGNEDTDADADVSVTGINLTPSAGDVEAFPLTVVPTTGVSLTSQIGNEIARANADVPVTGVSASVSLPSPLVFTGFGDAQISTAQSKFGGASLLLDGTGDYLESEGAYNFGSDPFTIDMWVRPTSGTQDGIFFDSRDSTSNDTIALRQSTDNLLVIRGNVTLFNINNVFSVDTWVHIAVTRGNPFGNTYSVFVNGVKQNSSLFGATPTAANIHIGSDFNGSNNWEGYIDELRVANVDEYGGTDFTPPTSAYTADENIPILLHFDGANGSTTFTNDGIVQSVTVTANADIQVSGNSLTSLIGNEEITGDANVSLTGIGLTSTVADVEAISIYTVSGSELTTAVGQATADDASAETTGVSATISTGSVNVTAWSEINPGVTNVWTEVDKAA